jgi:hypothetical protein
MSDFNTGYLIACANLVNLHDQPGMAADLVAELGVTWKDVTAMNLSEYDMEALEKIKHERGGSVFARNTSFAAIKR